MNDYTQIRILKRLMKKLKARGKNEGQSALKYLEKVLKEHLEG